MEYRLLIEPYCYYNRNSGVVLFYNSLDGNRLESHDKVINDFFRLLEENEMYYEEPLSGVTAGFLAELRDAFMVEMLPTGANGRVNITSNKQDLVINDLKKLKAGEKVHVIRYLRSLNIQMVSSCARDCSYCSIAYRQVNCCHKTGMRSIPSGQLKLILSQLGKNARINLTGGDILVHPEILEIAEFVKNSGYVNTSIIIHAASLDEARLDILKNLGVNVHIHVISDQNNIEFLVKHADFFSDKNYSFLFLVRSEEEYNNLIPFAETHFEGRYEFKPLFEDNPVFFEDNVFLDAEDLWSQPQALSDIMTRRLINTNFFGKLYIMSDGEVFLNPNLDRVGNIHNDRIADIIRTELENRTAWFRIRKDSNPCSLCVYNELCPSISNTELILNRSNLCHYNPVLSKWKGETGYQPV